MPDPAARLVDPRILHDAKYPAVEPRAGLELVLAQQRAFRRDLHEIVSVLAIERQRARETAHAGQQIGNVGVQFHPVSLVERRRRGFYSLRRTFYMY